MRLKLRVLALLIGIGLMAIGSQWYIGVAQTGSLMSPDKLIPALKGIGLSSIVVVTGMGLAIRAIIPRNSESVR